MALSYICTMSPYGKGRAVYACIMSWPRRDRSGRSLMEAIRSCWLAPRWSSVSENPKEHVVRYAAHSLLHSRILTVNILVQCAAGAPGAAPSPAAMSAGSAWFKWWMGLIIAIVVVLLLLAAVLAALLFRRRRRRQRQVDQVLVPMTA